CSRTRGFLLWYFDYW
nr:immunoglobulin heavy chain junction region [Macaca mulatta]MOW85611.1 immunoglobulin heavy chain junction region [Macaca mulatta]